MKASDCCYLIRRITLKNIGQSKVKNLFKKRIRLSYLDYSGRRPGAGGELVLLPDSGVVYGMFEEDDDGLSRGKASLMRKIMFSLPGDCTPAEIQARLMSCTVGFSE